MNRWVLLEHRICIDNLVEVHYDFLIENKLNCLTWKFLKIPCFNKGFVEIIKQPNHRLIWLTRKNYTLSRNRGVVKRIDNGTFINSYLRTDSREYSLILDGSILSGILEIKGNLCRLTKKA